MFGKGFFLLPFIFANDNYTLSRGKTNFFKFKSRNSSYFDKEFRLSNHVPERIRTAGLPLRRRTLYPAELQTH